MKNSIHSLIKAGLIGVVFYTTSIPLFSQSYYDKTNAHLKERIEYYNRILLSTEKGTQPIPYSTEEYGLTDSTIDSLIDKQVAVQKKVIRKQWGLQLSGGYTYNSTLAPIDEEFFAYKNKAQATLSWNLMDAAVVGVRPKLKQVELEGDIEKIRLQQNETNLVYDQIISAIEAKYKKINLGLQLVRRDLLNDLQQTYETMYRYSDAKLETLYEINYEKTMIESSIAEQQEATAAEVIDFQKETFDFSQLYVVVDSLLLDYAYATNPENNISEKEIALLESKAKQTKYVNDINLSPFVRYQYLTYPGSYTNRSNVQAGINLTIPISGHYKSEKQAMVLKQSIAQNQINHNKKNIRHEASLLLDQHKKQVQTLLGDFNKLSGYKLLFLNNLHTSSVKPVGVNGLNSIKIIDSYLKQLISYFANRQNYEKQLAAIQLFLNGTPLTDFCVAESLSDNVNQIKQTTGAYVWTRQHAVESPESVAEQLWVNGITNAYIGYSIDRSANHYNRLIEAIGKYDIKSELCLSSIKLSLEEEGAISAYLDNLLAINGFTGIQLDIEPHQLKDWESRQSYYLDRLANMVQVTSKWCIKNGKSLSIALPYTYPESFYNTISPYVNDLIVMMYNKKAKTITDSLAGNAFFGESTNRYRVAVRPEDFIGSNEEGYVTLLDHASIKGIDLESLSTLTAVKMLAPRIKPSAPGNYSLILDNTVTKMPIDQIKAKIGSRQYKTFTTRDDQGNIILEISGIRTEKEAVRFFGILIREK